MTKKNKVQVFSDHKNKNIFEKAKTFFSKIPDSFEKWKYFRNFLCFFDST